jgi:polysaccharide biosynthesis transport protein
LPAATPPTEPDSQQESHLSEHIDVLLRRRRLILAVLLAVTSVATVRTLLTRPIYQASAQILIARETPSVLTFKEVTQVDSARDDYYQTQYKLLQSRVLARKVIADLDLLRHPEFGGPRTPEQIEAIKAAPAGASPELEAVTDVFLQHLKVDPVRNSQLVSVRFEAFSPDLAAQCANRLSQLYIQQTLDFRYQTSSEAGEWLGGQIEQQPGGASRGHAKPAGPVPAHGARQPRAPAGAAAGALS